MSLHNTLEMTGIGTFAHITHHIHAHIHYLLLPQNFALYHQAAAKAKAEEKAAERAAKEKVSQTKPEMLDSIIVIFIVIVFAYITSYVHVTSFFVDASLVLSNQTGGCREGRR